MRDAAPQAEPGYQDIGNGCGDSSGGQATNVHGKDTRASLGRQLADCDIPAMPLVTDEERRLVSFYIAELITRILSEP